MIKKKFKVEGMSCAACQAHVKSAVEKLPGTFKVNVNLLSNSMDVEVEENVCSDQMICDAVKKAGYKAVSLSPLNGAKKADVTSSETDYSLAKLITAIVILLVLMYFSMGNMMWGFASPAVFDHHKNPAGNALLQLLLTIPILFIYRNYFISGFKKLFKGKPNMDSLIAVGATASLVFSLFATFMITYSTSALSLIARGELTGDVIKYESVIKTYTHTLYYEAAAMILTLVSLGKYFEGLSKRKTTDAVKKLMDLAPKTAIVSVDGEEKEVPIESVKVGDVVVVKKGGSVPVDGIITEGSASFDQSNITGESVPVFKESGEEVFSSTTVTAGYVKIRATKVGEDTSFSNIVKLVEEAANSKAPISRLADKISGIFVPLIFAIAAATFIVNLFVQLFSVGAESSAAFEISFRFAISVIVIACPCALGLATPVAIMVGTGKGAENGLIIKNAEILEKAHLIKTVVLDKTGTITEGKPKVTDFIGLGEQNIDILSAIYSLEAKSEHPLAAAITEYAEENGAILKAVSDYTAEEGVGVRGKIDGKNYCVGNSRALKDGEKIATDVAEEFSNQGKTPLFVTENGKAVAVISVKDSVKETSRQAVAALKAHGVHVVMLTGDNETTAKNIAAEVGIDEVVAEVLPSDKQRVVNSLKTDGKHLVAMVGDGVNDAPALTSADVGIAVGGGSDAAMEAGDVVLLRKSLTDVVNVIALSRRTINTIKLSLFWAFFYNFICVLIATGAFYYIPGVNFGIKPEYGSIAMSFSSVSVVLTALTINFFKPEKDKSPQAEQTQNQTITLKVNGMMCKMCEAHVVEAAFKVEGVNDAAASHETGTLTLTATKEVSIDKIKEAVRSAGYKVVD